MVVIPETVKVHSHVFYIQESATHSRPYIKVNNESYDETEPYENE